MSVDHFSLFSFRLKLSFLFSVVPQRLNPISTFQSGHFKIVNISISNGQHGGGSLKFHKKEVCNIWTATKLSDHRILTNIPDNFQSNNYYHYHYDSKDYHNKNYHLDRWQLCRSTVDYIVPGEMELMSAVIIFIFSFQPISSSSPSNYYSIFK